MKIIQLIPELNEGGVERGVVELSRELVSLGFESVVISNGGKLVEQLEHDGALHVKVNICSKNIFTAPFRIFKLYQTLKTLSPNVLHVRSRVPAWMVFFANAFLHIRVVSTVHGFNSVSFYSRIMTRSDHVICVSNAIKTYIQKHYDTPESNITVIPRGIDLDKFNPSHLDEVFMGMFKSKFDLQDKWVISTVGRITQLKDLETFIEAIALLAQEFPNVVGLIVGGVREDKQNYFASLQRLIESLHVKKYIHFCGSSDKVAEIYSLSDVVVSSSKKPESFGRSVAEAIALGTPVIATNHGGVLDIIREGIHGYFVNIGDANDLAAKIVQAKDLKFDGYHYIKENFSLEKMVTQTLHIYESFMKMTLCHINLSPLYGGAEKNFVDLCNFLSQQGFNVIAIVPFQTKYLTLFHHAVKVQELKASSSRYNPFLWLQILKIIRQFQPKIVHSHSNKATEIIYYLHKIFPSLKHAATKHNDRKGKIFDKVQHPIAVSNLVAKSIKQANVTTIYNGIELKATLNPSKLEVFTFLCVGRLDAIKQFDKVITAISKLPFPTRLLIAGTGRELQALTQQINQLNLQEKVTLLGFVVDVPSLMNTAHAVIINSKSEGFSYSLIEGLLYAPVVISTSVGVAPELLTQELIFTQDTLCDKMSDVYHHYDNYQYIAQNNRKKALSVVTIDAVGNNLITLYKRILNANSY